MKRKTFLKLSSVGLFSTLVPRPILHFSGQTNDLKSDFKNPPAEARAWVFWFWINGNVSKEGITKDLESFKEVGIGGVLWMGVGGKRFAPPGKIKASGPAWQDAMQWAIREAARLGLEFDMTVGFGYDWGGVHITPDISMQELVSSKTVVNGGKKINIALDKPMVSKEKVEQAKSMLRPGIKLDPQVLDTIEKIDSYKDIAVWATPYADKEDTYQIPQLDLRKGFGYQTYFTALKKMNPPEGAVIPAKKVIDLTNRMDTNGRLLWNAPPGKWQIIRLGHASNYKMTRPRPHDVVGLEIDHFNQRGIDTHFKYHLEPIFKKAGTHAGKTLKYVHVDSWEAGYQDWTPDFDQEFSKRRGYDIRPWLPVLTGTVVENPEWSDRFLWDFRLTISELICENFIARIRQLASGYGIEFSNEAYGHLAINSLDYAGIADLPMAEFWTVDEKSYFPHFRGFWYNSMKEIASASHTFGRRRAGAEAFTGNRSFSDFPYKLKGMGDEAFCQGINHFVLHYSAHQAYDNIRPGLTHHKWGHHWDRYNTWFFYSKPWFDYIQRSQYMLQQGRFVADVIYFFGEGSSLSVIQGNGMELDLPQGYDYDLCSTKVLRQMKVQNETIVLPSGMRYPYLLLPKTDRMTLASAQKILELAKDGAKIIVQNELVGTPGLTDHAVADQKIKQIAQQLQGYGNCIQLTDWNKIFQNDNIVPDFQGTGLNYIHRKTAQTDFYFVANPEPKKVTSSCTFRIADKIPELWDPETGETRDLPAYTMSGGRLTTSLQFEPFQSWFIIFQKTGAARNANGKNFPQHDAIKEISGPWHVAFDPAWGGPATSVRFPSLQDWCKHNEQGIRYYSGTATYKKSFDLPASALSESGNLLLDLGEVHVMARVRVNGKSCGIAWKPPYRVNVSEAIKSGENRLEIDVVNLWPNRMIGDARLYPEDCEWQKDGTLDKWPEWFLNNRPRPSGRYVFATNKYFTKEGPMYYKTDNPLIPSGLLGPVRLLS